jgi:Putative peptidoglycan binding domain
MRTGPLRCSCPAWYQRTTNSSPIAGLAGLRYRWSRIMRLRRALPLTLALLLAAECGVSAAAGSAKPRSAGSKASGSAASGGARARKSSRHSKRRERGQKAPTPDRISEIQQALAKDGSYTGTPSGKWDDSTVEAMKKFQAGHGLNPSGKLDALTLQKLGLGSQTAGVAAPIPHVTSSSAATSATQTAKRD